MWHYAKTPRSTSRFLEIILGVIFWKVCDCPILGGLFERNGNPALWLCGIMQKHHRALADFEKKILGYFLKVYDCPNIVIPTI